VTAARPQLRTLVIDNYDSFTYNLCHYLGHGGDTEIVVIRNDDRRFRLSDLAWFDCVVISPGPGRPEKTEDFGFCEDVLRAAPVPVLGVCLGHQGLCHVFRGKVSLAPEPYHGRTSLIWHGGDELFGGIPSPFLAVRYHSLIAGQVPGELRVIARTDDGLPMGLRHRSRPLWGVQFHPESICTEHGIRLLANFLRLAADGRTARPSQTRTPRPLAELTWSAARVRPAGAGNGPRDCYRVLARRLTAPIDAESIFHGLYQNSDHAFWLDSSLLRRPGGDAPRDRGGEFSFMGDASGPLALVASADVGTGEITVLGRNGQVVHRGMFLSWIRDHLTALRVEIPPLPFSFALGWVGYLGYELKAQTSGAMAHAAAHPDAWMIFADRAIAFDHRHDELYLLALARQGDEKQAVAWLDDTQRRIAGLPPAAPQRGPVVRGLGPASLRHGRDAYLRLIEACQREIRAGESYEVCLTNMVDVPATLDPWPAYRKVRRDNPVPYGAYLRFADLSVLSSSPERLLRISSEGEVESKPIKGTRPRGSSPADDERLRDDLAVNVKDRAENLMIVDLVRNDLGSCAEVGSVTVDHLFDVETYSSVHQLVSTVRARLRPGVHGTDCVQAVFPGGSMTGAPKIRTMQIIDRFEAAPRGIYSGSIGYFSLSGALDLSITIRTLVATPGHIQFGVGGAIIALSDPATEFEETAVKAAALLSLIGQEFPERFS
jgi:para-aminobenzoate synthetase